MSDILQIAGAKTKLRQSGAREWVGRCPLPAHPGGDRTPSFYVNPDKDGGVWHCFGCGRGGSVYLLQAVLAGRPVSDFLPRRRQHDLAGLQERLARVGRRRAPAGAVGSLFREARAVCRRIFQASDRLLERWSLRRLPTQPAYAGSQQEYADLLEADLWLALGRAEAAYRAGKLRGDVAANVAGLLRSARRGVRAAIGPRGHQA